MNVSIIVLAAGASQRMGTPKPLLRFNGETCLSLVLAACLGSKATETVFVLGEDAERIREALGSLTGSLAPGQKVRTAVNDRPERGQTSSLKIGLEQTSGRTDAFVLFPVDHPLVTSADIDSLIARFEPRPRGRTIFIPAHENRRGHPVLFAASHRSAILELEDNEPLHNYVRLREGEVDQVPVENPGVATGMNSPEEYRKALALYRSRISRA